MATAIARPGYTAEDNTIKIALIGCGGRGTGAAAQALSTQGPTRIVGGRGCLPPTPRSEPEEYLGTAWKPGRRAAGTAIHRLGWLQKAMATLRKGDIVLLTTPPAFGPFIFNMPVKSGCNVFMEKSFAVDAPGISRVLRTGEMAREKNLKVAGGLMSRHYKPLEEAVQTDSRRQ